MNKLFYKFLIILYILIITIGVGSVFSVVFFLYYFFLFFILSYTLCSKHIFSFNNYLKYYLIASSVATTYILLQSTTYPETYGTTSRYGSWTDDSYFFTLIADKIPSKFFIERDNYFEYNSGFAVLLKKITPFRINFPIEVIFFQSGVMALLAILIKEANLLINNLENNIASYLTIFCPFLYMNGGAILVRDVLVATLFILEINFLLKKKYFIVLFINLLEIYIRPGTALILILIILFFFLPTIFQKIKSNLIWSIGIILFFSFLLLELPFEEFEKILVEEGVSIFGRDIFYSLQSGNTENQIYLKILNQPLFVKLMMTGIYFFLYPWISIINLKNSFGYDIRTILINIIYPLLNIAYNYYFILTIINKKEKTLKWLIYMYFVGLCLLGTYSLETRHKTILIPVFYLIISNAISKEKRIKFLPLTISIIIFLGTIVISLIK